MKSIHLVLILIVITGSSYAQQDQSVVTHYVFPEFTNGIVLKKDGVKLNALLNYNALTEEMVFEENGQKLVIAENVVNTIDTVFIKDRKFIVLNGKFVEVLRFPDWDIYFEYKCRVKEEGKPSAYSGTSNTPGADDLSLVIERGTYYEINLPGKYTADPYFYYWLNRNGEISRFINLRQLRKVYKADKDLFNEYVKDNNVKYTDKQSIIQLIEYLESI